MKKICLAIIIITLSSISFFGQSVQPYKGSRIFWDMGSKKMLFDKGDYARIIPLFDGRLMAVSGTRGGVGVTYSSDRGTHWTTPVTVVAGERGKMNNAVPDVIQLKDSTIIIGYNPRPLEPYSEDRRFGIRAIRSTDNGLTWSQPIFIYDAQSTFNDGCWEPAFLELPSGEVQCYFSNENDFTTDNDQNICICKSYDKGYTWGAPIVTSYRKGSRDGMPSPILLKDKNEIVYTIEDNGWPGRVSFATTTIRTSLDDNWASGVVRENNSRRKMIFQDIPANNLISAAPYLCQLPNGETVVSFQGNENRDSDDLEYFDMYVLVGDNNAMNFKAQSAPFSMPKGQHSIWNSVAAIGKNEIIAVGSVGEAHQVSRIEIIKGYAIDKAFAKYGTPTIDGKYSINEKWSCNKRAQLYMGHSISTPAIIDFMYDNKYLYLTARVGDKNIIDGDGLEFFIDAANVCSKTPQRGAYRVAFNADGTYTMKSGLKGKWITNNKTNDIKYNVDKQLRYYIIEAAIPWSALGCKAAPIDKRLAININLINTDSDAQTLKEGIADADNNAPWSWLEFNLQQK